MPILLLKFRIRLEERDPSTHYLNHGPLFHRWLPDGEKDAIVLDTSDPNSQLKIWFERWGFKTADGFIEFDHRRQEVNPDTVLTQAILDAGPLMGLLRIQGLLVEKLVCLPANKVGDSHYMDIGKEVVSLIQVPVVRFLDVLRTNYGQYWICRLEKWDSRELSLGAYCRRLNLEWSLDEGKTWAPFVPDNPTVQLTVTIMKDQDFLAYLTKDDWQELGLASPQRYTPSLSANLLASSHQFLDQDNLKHAFIEGVSALEIALGDFIRQKLDGDDFLTKSISSFWQLPLNAQIVSITSAVGTIPLCDVGLTVDAIKMRNQVVHEGWEPSEDTKHALSALLRTTAALLSGPRFRFPSINPGNKVMPLEEWKKQTEVDNLDR